MRTNSPCVCDVDLLHTKSIVISESLEQVGRRRVKSGNWLGILRVVQDVVGARVLLVIDAMVKFERKLVSVVPVVRNRTKIGIHRRIGIGASRIGQRTRYIPLHDVVSGGIETGSWHLSIRK